MRVTALTVGLLVAGLLGLATHGNLFTHSSAPAVPHVWSVADAAAWIDRRQMAAPGTLACQAGVDAWSYVCRFQYVENGFTSYYGLLVDSNGIVRRNNFFMGFPGHPASVTTPSSTPSAPEG